MKIGKALLLLTSSLSLSNTVHGKSQVLEVHGSGTTNPSKCIWHILSLFNQRSKVPIRMTYRAVGSSTGQAEFLGINNTDPNTNQDDGQDFLHWREFLVFWNRLMIHIFLLLSNQRFSD